MASNLLPLLRLLAISVISSDLAFNQSIDSEQLQKDVLTMAVRSQDELFHLKLYEWLISEHFGSLLLDIETPFILPFLESKYATRDDACKDLFWKYLARHGRFMEAAKLLDSIASSPEL